MRREERRKGPRVDVDAKARVWLPHFGPVDFRVEDLSVGGALLRGVPAGATERRVRMSLLVEGADPLTIDAEAVRWMPDVGDGATLAVAFRNLNVEQEDRIQEALLQGLEALNVPESGVRAIAATPDVDAPEPLRQTR